MHLVDAGVDTGPILAQQAVEVLDGDDESTLHERIKVVERRLFGGCAGRVGDARCDLDRQKGDLGMTGDLGGQASDWRALISVYDKSGLILLARGLHEAGIELVSTGSTAKTLPSRNSGHPRRDGDRLPGGPRRPGEDAAPTRARGVVGRHAQSGARHGAGKLEVAPFELVVVNLYPFSETVESGAEIDECVEQIDIGGPSMVRASAKNHASVAVVVSPVGYDGCLRLSRRLGFSLQERKKLAALAFPAHR